MDDPWSVSGSPFVFGGPQFVLGIPNCPSWICDQPIVPHKIWGPPEKSGDPHKNWGLEGLGVGSTGGSPGESPGGSSGGFSTRGVPWRGGDLPGRDSRLNRVSPEHSRFLRSSLICWKFCPGRKHGPPPSNSPSGPIDLAMLPKPGRRVLFSFQSADSEAPPEEEFSACTHTGA